MANDSSTGGYLVNIGAPALQDAALDALLQQVVVGLTGIDGSLVRPRWQPVVPKQPEPVVDWCAIGVTSFDRDDYPAEEHDGTGNGSDKQTRWETLSVLASLYGPNGNGNASALRDGLYVAQNREAMVAVGMDLVDAGAVTAAPDFVNQQWIRRYDVLIRLRRWVQRTYPVLNLLSAPTSITSN